MKICFIADSSSIHTQRIVSHSVRKGDEILVLSSALYLSDLPGTRTIHLLDQGDAVFTTSYEERKARTDLKARLKSVIPVSAKLLLIEIKRTVWLLSKRKFCAEEIRRFNPHVIFTFRSFPEGVLAAYCHIRPVALRTAGPDISKLPKYPVFRQLIRQAIRSADLVVTESVWEKRLLHNLCGSALKAEVIIIGIDTSLFRPPACKSDLRDRYNLPHDAFVVVSNRSLEGHYNGWLLVEAVESVLEQCPNLVLLYASPARMGLRAKARAEAVMANCSRIRFLDRRVPHAEVPDIVGCADIYVSLSAYDGIPNSVLEAMACGVVPIVAELPQLHEWVEHGKTGYFVSQRDVKGLASLIRDLYNNRERLPTIASRCVEKIRNDGSYEACMERTRELLVKLTKPPKVKDDVRFMSTSPNPSASVCNPSISD